MGRGLNIAGGLRSTDSGIARMIVMITPAELVKMTVLERTQSFEEIVLQTSSSDTRKHAALVQDGGGHETETCLLSPLLYDCTS